MGTKKLLRPKSAKLVLKLIKTNNDNVLTEIEMLNYCIALPNSHPKPQNNDDFSSTTIVPIQPTRVDAGPIKRMPSSLRKQITAKGSLRYNAKVALLMKKAKDVTNEHDISSRERTKQLEKNKIKARSRLSDRLQRRSRLIKKNENNLTDSSTVKKIESNLVTLPPSLSTM